MKRVFILLFFLLVPLRVVYDPTVYDSIESKTCRGPSTRWESSTFSLFAQGWHWQNPLPQRNQLEGVLFIDANTVWVNATNDCGTSAWSEVWIFTSADDRAIFPTDSPLRQNYPNPFNPITTIRYGLPERARVRLEVFQMHGESVAVLIDGEQDEEYRAAVFAGSVLASGVSISYLRENEFVRTIRHFLLNRESVCDRLSNELIC